MSKEYLEALKKLGQLALYGSYNELQVNETDEFDIVQQALQRLNQIENIKFSEALEIFLKAKQEIIYFYGELPDSSKIFFETLEPALLKAQELENENNVLLEENNDLYVELTFAAKQYKELIEGTKQYKKVLEIIKEKKVDIELLEFCEDSYEYNRHFSFIEVYHITEEEFELLKRWLK